MTLILSNARNVRGKVEMLMKFRHSSRANAVLEYVVLIVVIMAALIMFRVYIQRGMQGQLRKTGENFGFLRQYDPKATMDCAYDAQINGRYAQACFNHKIRRCVGYVGEHAVCVNAMKTECKIPACN